jgi:hypothetical protein
MTESEKEITAKWAEHIIWRSHCEGKQPIDVTSLTNLIWLACEEYLMSKKVPQYDKELRFAAQENKVLREAISKIVDYLGNGSRVSPQCSLGFLTQDVPQEVKLVVNSLRSRLGKIEALSKNT